MTRTLRIEEPEGLTLKVYLTPVDTGDAGNVDGYELIETADRQYEIVLTESGLYGRYRVLVEFYSEVLTSSIDSGYVSLDSADGIYIMQNKLPELAIATTVSDTEAFSAYGPKRVKTKEMEIEQFSPLEIQKANERASATLPTFCSGPACIGRYKNEKCH